MARVTGSLPAPTQVSGTVRWGGADAGEYVIPDVSALLAGGATGGLRQLTLVQLSQTINVETAASTSEDPDVAGPEFSSAFETNVSAIILRAPTLNDLTLPGPLAPGNNSADSSDPYTYRPPADSSAVYSGGLGRRSR